MISFSLRDAVKKYAAKITKAGQVTVSTFDYDETEFKTLDVVDAAYNFYAPKVKHNFIITGILAFADKDISDANDTVITIYEGASAETTTVKKTLLQFGMGKLTTLPFVPLNIKVNPGVWVNAKTGDDDIHMTIMGYYIPEE